MARVQAPRARGGVGEGLGRVGVGGEWRPWEIELGRVRAREGLRNRGEYVGEGRGNAQVVHGPLE